MPNRRQVLKGLGMSMAALAANRALSGTARADEKVPAKRPRYWLAVVPCGGMDAIYTVDPKSRRQVAHGIDLPYHHRKIVSAGNLRFAPHFASLAEQHERLAIVNGVLVKAANHYTGVEQLVRLRTGTTAKTPGIFDIIGAHRDSQALAHVVLKSPLRQGKTQSYLGSGSHGDFGGGGDVFSMLEDLSPDELRELAGSVAHEASSIKRAGNLSPQRRQQVDAMGQTGAFLERVAGAPRFEPFPWLGGELKGKEQVLDIGPVLQRALWLFENDLSACVTGFMSPFRWDSHFYNARIQGGSNPLLANGLVAFFRELDKRSNRFGKLSEQTAVIVISEIGRFPYLNAAAGKDHFPQVPVILAGPTFPGDRTFGGTGKEMEALPVDDRGRPHDGGRRMLLDDIGLTLLSAAGIAPHHYGVSGHPLRFLQNV